MLRSVLDPQGGMQDSTPLRGRVSFPRIRLTDKHSKLSIPIFTLSAGKVTTGVSPLRHKISGTKIGYWSPKLHNRERQSTADRFIPQRRHINADVVRYNLGKKSPHSENSTEIDLFGQIAALDVTWRRKLMKSNLEKVNVISGMNNRRVLNFAECKAKDRENRQSSRVDNASDQNRGNNNGKWRVKARDKPLIGARDFEIEMPTSRFDWIRGWLDWGAQDFIATINDMSVHIFDVRNHESSSLARRGQCLTNVNSILLAVKWNHAGTRIAVGTAASELRVYTMEKFCWSVECRCVKTEDNNSLAGQYCHVMRIAWTQCDTTIVTVCTEGKVAAYTSSGIFITAVYPDPHLFIVSTISFSPNNRYLAVATYHQIRLYLWPSLKQYLDIGPLSSRMLIKSIAWHPWDTNILCIGGCPDHRYLSLWDINRHEFLGRRRVSSNRAFVDDMTWNKLSGELVVRWDYWENNNENSVVAVLANLDSIVDLVSVKTRCSGLVWNPNGTQLALRTKGYVVVWDFFGNETKKWYDCDEGEKLMLKKEELKRRRARIADQTIHFENYNIR